MHLWTGQSAWWAAQGGGSVNPDGWQEPDGEPFRRFWEDLMGSAYGPPTPPPLRFACSVCDGDGRLAHQDERECTWLMTCPACDGSGSMCIVPERKGTR